LLLFTQLISNTSQAQLKVTNTRTINDLVQNVLADRGVFISQISSSANLNAIAFFDGTNSNIGLDSGIFLSTGITATAVGPNTVGNTGSSNNQPGDALIKLIDSSENNFDAAWIEFDVTAESDSLKFRFVFASEEYPENINKNFNDIFGLFISGPSITGFQNLAVIPNTNTPISIRTVNSQNNSQYYIDNTNGMTVEFDGFTRVFEASVKVVPCLTYKLKFVIADVKDLIYDSGIFIEAKSLKSINGAGVSTSSFLPSTSECDSNIINILRNSNDLSKDLKVKFSLGGSATLNVDYTISSRDSVIIPAGQKFVSLRVVPIKDAIAEPSENVILTVTDPVICDTIKQIISIKDYKFIDKLEFKYICGDSTIKVGIKDYDLLDSILWKDRFGNVVSILPILEFNANDTNYYYIYGIESCTGKKIVDSVKIRRYIINTIPDTTICFGDTLFLFANSTVVDAKYEWSGSTEGIYYPSPLSASPFIVPQRSGLITVRITNDGICANKEIYVTVNKLTVESNNVSACGKQSVVLKASGGTKYKWIPSTFLSNDTIAEPICTADTSITYQLTISNDKCSVTMDVYVRVDSMPRTKTIDDTYICSRQFVMLSASGSSRGTYEWFPKAGLDSPYSANPRANPIVTTQYIVKGSNGACFNYDTVMVYVIDSIGTDIIFTFDSCNRTFYGSQTLDDGKASIMWDMGNGDTLIGKEVKYVFDKVGNYNIKVISNPLAPCSTSTELNLNYPLVDAELRKIPSAFSPNNDGNNDLFKIYFGNTQCKIEYLQIYSRWGELVFDSNRDNTFEWDGKYKGQLCEQGIYVYIIKGDGFEDKGWLALMR
jgi:gliding motility-associated-like protein